MTDDLTKLSDWITPLLAKFNDTERRKLMVSVARDMRRRNQVRIRKQIAPDGTPYAPRLRSKRKQIRRAAMFHKLASAKHLRMLTTADSAAILWLGRAARIAEVHHKGLRDRVSENGPMHDYAQRELLGFSREDHQDITDAILNYLSAR